MVNFKTDKIINEKVEQIVKVFAGDADMTMRAVLGSLITAVEDSVHDDLRKKFLAKFYHPRMGEWALGQHEITVTIKEVVEWLESE